MKKSLIKKIYTSKLSTNNNTHLYNYSINDNILVKDITDKIISLKKVSKDDLSSNVVKKQIIPSGLMLYVDTILKNTEYE